jgi:hypothetical protein
LAELRLNAVPVSVNLRAARPKLTAPSNAKSTAAAYPMPSWQDADRYLRGAVITAAG